MTREVCASIWKTVIKCYQKTIESNNPAITMAEIVNTIGLDNTKEIFATVSKIKEHDGRIYGANREYMNSIAINPDNVVWESSNPLIYAGLDEIHTAHINNLITELRKF